MISARLSRTHSLALATAFIAGLAAGVSAEPVSPQAQVPHSQPSGQELVPIPSGDEKGTQHRIQLAVLLDTSNSMDGLINQARVQLWNLVTELSKVKKDNKSPRFEVALYQYGNDGLSAETGFVQRVLAFTANLDEVSEKLFQLKTNGGSEFCGQAIQHATLNLDWSSRPEDLRMIVIAGNEPFTQGAVDYRTAIPAAAGKRIVLNTIHCGTRDVGEQTMWADGAKLGNGKFANIDSNTTPVHIDTPYDTEINDVGVRINDTYIPFGAHGEEGVHRQLKADADMRDVAPAAEASRNVAKSTAYYQSQNASWDLVDALNTKQVELKDLKEEVLPENMRKMTLAERTAFVEGKIRSRQEHVSKLAELTKKRESFIAEAQAKAAATGAEATFGAALILAIREQAASAGFVTETSAK